jgi:hypothetical protein
MNRVITVETNNIQVSDKVAWFKHNGYVKSIKDDLITIQWYSRAGVDVIPRKYFYPIKMFAVKGF